MLRFMNCTIAASGPGHQLRYASVDLSLVRLSGGRSSTSSTRARPCVTASACAVAMPAMPAPQMTMSAEVGGVMAGGK